MRKTKRLLFSSNFDPWFPLHIAKIEERRNREKNQPSTIQIFHSRGPFFSPLITENKITFLKFLAFLDKKTGCGQRLQGQNQNLTQPFTEPSIVVYWKYKKFGSQLSNFVVTGHKEHFRNILTQIFKFGYFSWYYTHILEKYKLDLLMKNLMLNQLAPT